MNRSSWFRIPLHLITKMRTITFLSLLAFLIAIGTTVAGAAEPKRLALMGAEQSPLGNLLMVHLSKSSTIALVERELLQKALAEASILDLWVNRTKRSRLGKVLGADFIALIEVTDENTRLVICDTKLGVILQEVRFNLKDQTYEQLVPTLATLVQEVITSYAKGISQVVAVPDFICRDLTYDFSYLQKDFAEVLKAAFRRSPGVAIVAVDEAGMIAMERDLAGLDQDKRPVSLFIEGEYRTKRVTPESPVKVTITLRSRNSSKAPVEHKLPPVALSQAGRELMRIFSRKLAGLTDLEGTMIDEEAQYHLLVGRAEEFGSIGEFQRSAALREAALLLKPDADEQRIRLIREYARNNRNPYESQPWPKGARFDESNPLWVAAFNRSVTDWKRSLQHCEYLVLNRRLSREEATNLAYNAIHSITGVRSGSSNLLGDCEVLKKDFVRHVFSRIASLEPASREARSKLSGALDVYNFLFANALFRCDGNFHTGDDLDLVSDLLINRLPDSMWPSIKLGFFLRSAAGMPFRKDEASKGFTEGEYLAFLDRLKVSDIPLVRIYGRYGKVCFRRLQGEKSPPLLEEAEGMLAEAASAGFNLRDHSYFMNQLRSEVRSLTPKINKKASPNEPVPPPKIKEKKPVPKSRVLLEPISLMIANAKGEKEPIVASSRWLSHGERIGLTNFRPLTEGLDALWSRGAVFFMPRQGEIVKVLADEKLSVADVVYDGSNVWVASFYDRGLSVFNRDGRELARISQKDGLPPCGIYGLVIHPIEPGKVLVAGSFGNERRGWIAIVQFDGTKGTVEVIHEATKVWNYKQPADRYSTDPAKTFIPQAVIEHIIPGPKPRRIIIIQRGRGQPLMVDPESLKVWVYPANPTTKKWFPRSSDPPADAFLSKDGILWVAGSMADFCSYRLNQKSSLFEGVRKRERWHGSNGRSGSLARDGEWLYYAGNKWRRLNLKTGQEEILVENYRALPHAGSGDAWRLAISQHYGLVAFHKGQLYRVRVTQ